ncbi:uncharacterized protein [Aegilops tauschii subsp. strangulata]|uniref:Uncharacterized protein n=1 Tax=Aegilops tauschii subsp. strangulata TaxID=200361 RepID=A0A453GPA3_AEGTS|nr:uncharacterized protein LOC109747955 isoform X2 [Aegilops tauschii subsp. strangulata]XP_020162591.1 uncharacterized protein LOC109747955 isoform X2 [Aegilops tauschii subsp. strangulata]
MLRPPTHLPAAAGFLFSSLLCYMEEDFMGSGGDADGRREVRGLDGVMATDVRRGEAAARHLPLAPLSTRGAGHMYDGFLHPQVAWHEADIDRGLLELRARARDVTAAQLKAAAAIGQVWLVEAARCASS